MPENIVAGLFGLTPYQVQQQRMMQGDQSAANFAQLDPFQKANYGMYKGAGMLAGAGAQALGMVDPMVQEAQQREQALQGLDMTSPQSIMQRAAQTNDPRLKAQLVLAAQQRQAAIDESRLKQAQTLKALQTETEPEVKYASPVAKLLAERAKYPVGSAEYVALTDAIRKETYIKPEKADEKPISNIDAKRISAVSTLGDAANPALQLLDQADALYSKYVSGLDEPILGRAARVGAMVGLGGEQAADYEVGGQIAKDLGVIKLGLIGGSDTERELKVAIDTSPSPDKRPSTNKTIIENQRRAIQVLQAQPDFMAEWINKNGSLSNLDKKTGEPYGKAWRKYQKDNFQPVTTPSKEEVKRAAMPKTGEIRSGYRFKGGNPNDKSNWIKANG